MERKHICRKGDCKTFPAYTIKARHPSDPMHVCGRHVKWAIDFSLPIEGLTMLFEFKIGKYRAIAGGTD